MWFNLLGRGDASRVQTGVVSTDFFDVLGVAAGAGPHVPGRRRLAGCAGGAASSATRTGRARSAATPASSAAAFEMNDRVHTVVGVLPPMPQFPDENDVYMPPSACPFRSNPQTIANRNARMLTAIGRLRPDATLAAGAGRPRRRLATGWIAAVSRRRTTRRAPASGPRRCRCATS